MIKASIFILGRFQRNCHIPRTVAFRIVLENLLANYIPAWPHQKTRPMAEILGVIASAAQLTQFSFKISASLTEICTRLNGAADLQKYLVQIKQLQDTTLLIQYNTELQSSIVKQQLESAITEAEYLESLLSCTLREYTQGNLARRIFNAAKGGKESDIVSSLKRLEQEKTSLVICLTISNSATLSSIQGDLTCLIRKNIQVYTRGTAIPTMNQDSSQVSSPETILWHFYSPW